MQPRTLLWYSYRWKVAGQYTTINNLDPYTKLYIIHISHCTRIYYKHHKTIVLCHKTYPCHTLPYCTHGWPPSWSCSFNQHTPKYKIRISRKRITHTCTMSVWCADVVRPNLNIYQFIINFTTLHNTTLHCKKSELAYKLHDNQSHAQHTSITAIHTHYVPALQPNQA